MHEARSPEAAPWVRATSLTPYLSRAHDRWLTEVLGPTVQGGPSVLAVLTGESTVGKTRAMYEAIVALAPDWPLHAPADAEELVGLLDAGEVAAGSVLWLNEAQRHFAGPGGEAAALRLDRLLAATTGIVAVGSLWRRPYCDELTRGREVTGHPFRCTVSLAGSADRHDPVPDRLTDAERAALPDGDDRLLRAAAAGTADGRVIQQLTGGPELVRAYHDGGLFSPREHALLTAALDIRRLGIPSRCKPHFSPPPPRATWRRGTAPPTPTGAPRRSPRSPTAPVPTALGPIRHGLTALTTIRVQSGTEPSYLPADYLDMRPGPAADTSLARPNCGRRCWPTPTTQAS